MLARSSKQSSSNSNFVSSLSGGSWEGFDWNSDDDSQLMDSAFGIDMPDQGDYISTTSKSFLCLRPEDIADRQESLLEQVNPVVGPENARVLLEKYNWDPQKMLECYAEDPEGVLSSMGLSFSDERGVLNRKAEGECPICFDDGEVASLQCGHTLCIDCWKRYLSIQVREKISVITCAETSCSVVLDDFIVFQLLGDRDAEARHKSTMVESYVKNNPRCVWCPSPGCTNALLLLSSEENRNEVVECRCGAVFCFRCRFPNHQPCTCEMMRDWRKKAEGGDEDMVEKMMKLVSRPCPNSKCRVPIEKNAGCNHMTCFKCQYHFCWNCMGKFGSGPMGGTDGYSSHSCNGHYMEDGEVQLSRKEVERFAHYHDRYQNHLRSKGLEEVSSERLEMVRRQLMDNFGLSRVGTEYIEEAHGLLMQARLTLATSYAFGYYRPTHMPNVNQSIFEDLQGTLERFTEQLSGTVKDMTDLDHIFNERENLLNLTKILHTSLHALHDASSEWSSLILAGAHSEFSHVEESPKKAQKTEGNKRNKGLRKIFFRG